MAEHLSTYLNDHYAGSAAGLELAQRAAASNEGTELGTLLERLAAEIEEERAVLRSVIDAVGAEPNPAKAALAWAGEKAGRLKPNNQLSGYSPLSRLVEVEGLTMGIEGKRLLFVVLSERDDPRLTAYDFVALAERAQRQRDELEPFRLAAAATAFAEDVPAPA